MTRFSIVSFISECPALSSPDHGQVTPGGSVPYPDTVNYTCNSGFNIIGETTRNCQSDGSWSGTDPTCIEKGIILFYWHSRSILSILHPLK